jgi:hypothetical protein
VPGLYGVDAALLGVPTDLDGALLLSIEPAHAAYSTGTSNQPTNATGTSAPLDTVGRGFLLHNTNSRPIRFDDLMIGGVPIRVLLDPPPNGRLFVPIEEYTGTMLNGTFSILYETDANGNSPAQLQYGPNVLGYTWQPRFTQPQPMLTGNWSAPFLYEDRKSILYVATSMYSVAIAGGGPTPFGLQTIPLNVGTAGDKRWPALRRPNMIGERAAAAEGAPTVRYQGAAISPDGGVGIAQALKVTDQARRGKGKI